MEAEQVVSKLVKNGKMKSWKKKEWQNKKKAAVSEVYSFAGDKFHILLGLSTASAETFSFYIL